MNKKEKFSFQTMARYSIYYNILVLLFVLGGVFKYNRDYTNPSLVNYLDKLSKPTDIIALILAIILFALLLTNYKKDLFKKILWLVGFIATYMLAFLLPTIIFDLSRL